MLCSRTSVEDIFVPRLVFRLQIVTKFIRSPVQSVSCKYITLKPSVELRVLFLDSAKVNLLRRIGAFYNPFARVVILLGSNTYY